LYCAASLSLSRRRFSGTTVTDRSLRNARDPATAAPDLLRIIRAHPLLGLGPEERIQFDQYMPKEMLPKPEAPGAACGRSRLAATIGAFCCTEESPP
jgi:hypothetical protein